MRHERLNLKLGTSGGRRNAGRPWREMFRRRAEMHDPMLVFNMSIFNFGGGWSRVLNSLQIGIRN
jgi:hypothetical protein